jgi:hypothetical protein
MDLLNETVTSVCGAVCLVSRAASRSSSRRRAAVACGSAASSPARCSRASQPLVLRGVDLAAGGLRVALVIRAYPVQISSPRNAIIPAPDLRQLGLPDLLMMIRYRRAGR